MITRPPLPPSAREFLQGWFTLKSTIGLFILMDLCSFRFRFCHKHSRWHSFWSTVSFIVLVQAQYLFFYGFQVLVIFVFDIMLSFLVHDFLFWVEGFLLVLHLVLINVTSHVYWSLSALSTVLSFQQCSVFVFGLCLNFGFIFNAFWLHLLILTNCLVLTLVRH